MRWPQAGTPIWIDRAVPIAHAKTMVIDGALTLMGSYNWTRNAARNSEDLNLVSSRALAAAYAEQWRNRLAVSVPFSGREDWCRPRRSGAIRWTGAAEALKLALLRPAGTAPKGCHMFDLIVSGGLAVLPAATEAADIGVAGGRIAAIGAPGSLAAAGAARTVDADGQIVIPGGVDPHIHCSSPIPFPGRNKDMLSAPPEQVSRAALHGGTTTLLDFAPCPPDQPLPRSIEMRQREWPAPAIATTGFICCCTASCHRAC